MAILKIASNFMDSAMNNKRPQHGGGGGGDDGANPHPN